MHRRNLAHDTGRHIVWTLLASCVVAGCASPRRAPDTLSAVPALTVRPVVRLPGRASTRRDSPGPNAVVRFDSLAAGRYLLRVLRLGYLAVDVTVPVTHGCRSDVEVYLPTFFFGPTAPPSMPGRAAVATCGNPSSGVTSSSGSAAAATRGACRAADETSATLLAYVRKLVSSADSPSVSLRRSLGLDDIAARSVALVSNAEACAKAGRSLDRAAGIPPAARRVYLIRAGNTRYFAQDPNATAAEYRPVFVMDSAFVILRALLAF